MFSRLAFIVLFRRKIIMEKISEKEAEEKYIRHPRVLKKKKSFGVLWLLLGWILLVLILVGVI